MCKRSVSRRARERAVSKRRPPPLVEPFFAQADENEDGALDAVEFAGFRSVIRSRAVKNAQAALGEYDADGDMRVSGAEAEEKASRDDDLEPKVSSGQKDIYVFICEQKTWRCIEHNSRSAFQETLALFNVSRRAPINPAVVLSAKYGCK